MKKTLLSLAVAAAISSPTLAETVIYIGGTRTVTSAVYDTYTTEKYYVVDDNNVVDIVSTTPGLNLVQSGPRGQQSSTFIRGRDVEVPSFLLLMSVCLFLSLSGLS